MMDLFYFLGLIPIMNELYFIFNAKALYDEQSYLNTLPVDKIENNIKVVKSNCMYYFATIFYMVWTMIGLFTFQSGLFLIIVLLGIMASKIKDDNFLYHKLDSMFCIGVILFIIYNYSILQINFSIPKLLGF